MLSYFQSQGHKVAGCDLDNQAVAYGRGQGVPLTHGSVTDLNLNWTPDIVILSHVVEHFLSPVSDLQDIRRLLDADSRLYVEVPGIKRLSPLSAYYQADFLRQLQNAHNFYFSARSLGNLFRTAMFSVENINEDIRAIFAPADINNIEIRPDYQDALNHLQRLEWYHRYNLHRLGTIPQLAYHPAVLSALKRTGLYPFAKRVHDAFF
ncbi:hypothetical protein DJ79_02585 [Halorubrum ezzemoulense]|uniref:Methyltransferase domain-containing protein n=2 Tax=Halorubrum ezzemoulense TaxID=337243 RepID=A0A256JM10_HALEZ|nr:hypothetical protein DJ79_02585 [Halorubrum ezzemoulense]